MDPIIAPRLPTNAAFTKLSPVGEAIPIINVLIIIPIPKAVPILHNAGN